MGDGDDDGVNVKGWVSVWVTVTVRVGRLWVVNDGWWDKDDDMGDDDDDDDGWVVTMMVMMTIGCAR